MARDLYAMLTSISEKFAERTVRNCHWKKYNLLMSSCSHTLGPLLGKLGDEGSMVRLLSFGCRLV